MLAPRGRGLAAERAASREAPAPPCRALTSWAPPRPLPVLPPPDHEATFEELPAAAERTQENAGALVGTEGPAEILGLTPQNVGRLPANGRLLWLPTGRPAAGPPGSTAGLAQTSQAVRPQRSWWSSYRAPMPSSRPTGYSPMGRSVTRREAAPQHVEWMPLWANASRSQRSTDSIREASNGHIVAALSQRTPAGEPQSQWRRVGEPFCSLPRSSPARSPTRTPCSFAKTPQ